MSDENQKAILVVDDESHICLMMEDLLMDKYDVLTAGDGLEALEIIAANRDKIGLVITDIMMPKMDGMSLLKEMKTRYPEIGVMMISAHSDVSELPSQPSLGNPNLASNILRIPRFGE